MTHSGDIGTISKIPPKYFGNNLVVTRRVLGRIAHTLNRVGLANVTRFRWILLLCVLGIVAVLVLLHLVDIGGGSTFESPDGNYYISTWSSLRDSPGGEYTVELFQEKPPQLLRSVTVRVAKNEKTPVMRGRCEVRWDMTAGTAELIVDDRPELRLYLHGER